MDSHNDRLWNFGRFRPCAERFDHAEPKKAATDFFAQEGRASDVSAPPHFSIKDFWRH
jgi:hypothetical protein